MLARERHPASLHEDRIAIQIMQILNIIHCLLVATQVVQGAVVFQYPSAVEHGGFINVSWTASASDAIGLGVNDTIRLYCPPLPTTAGSSTDFHIDEWPLRHFLSAPSNPPTSGSVLVGPLVNMRESCQLRFFQYDAVSQTYQAFSVAGGVYPTFNFTGGASQPLQGHVALVSLLTIFLFILFFFLMPVSRISFGESLCRVEHKLIADSSGIAFHHAKLVHLFHLIKINEHRFFFTNLDKWSCLTLVRYMYMQYNLINVEFIWYIVAFRCLLFSIRTVV